MSTNRATFGSKLGVILATVGCAVGLGSIWRFPYMVGENGGAAFLLVFIICTVLLGLPIMITEFLSDGIHEVMRPVRSRNWHHIPNGR